MYGYVYKITNSINSKIYIGKRVSEVFDMNYYGSGKLITSAIKKYSKENFSREILLECLSEEELRSQEEYWIQYFIDQGYELGKSMYNLKVTSVGGDTYTYVPEEDAILHKLRISNSCKGKKRTDCTKLKISRALKGKKKSKESIEKMKETKRANKKHWYTNGLPGKENNKKFFEYEVPEGFYRGRTYSEQQKKNCGVCNLGKIPWNKGLTKETDLRIKEAGLKESTTKSNK